MLSLKNLKTIRESALRESNILRKLFKSQGYSASFRSEGFALNGNALTRSFVSARSCRDNSDRYSQTVRKPQNKCAFSFAIDFSGSMSHGQNDNFLGYVSTWEQVLGGIHGLVNVAESVGITSKIAFIEFENADWGNGNCSYGRSEAVVIKDFNDKAWSDDYVLKLAQLQPHHGDDIAVYGRMAINMVESVNAEHKVAFFLTDGINEFSYQYFQSLNELAISKGVKLIGISFNTPLNESLPNNIFCKSARDLTKAVVKELEKLF